MIHVQSYLDKNGLPSSRKLSRPGVYELLKEATPWLADGASAAERTYALYHQLKSYPKKCRTCSGPITAWKSWSIGYFGENCSVECYSKEKSQKASFRKALLPQKVLLTKEERVARQEASNLARYGVRWPWMLQDKKKQTIETSKEKLAKKWREELIDNGYQPLFAEKEYRGNRQWCQVQHLKCNTVFSVQRLRWVGDQRQCPTCWSPRASKGQHDLAEWVRSLGVKVRVNDRKQFKGKMELDLFLPDHNLVIEYDGLYWHSERGRPDCKSKSWQKFVALKQAGLRYMMIFDDEWETKRHVVESRIRNALGLIEKKIMARCCTLVELNAQQHRSFMVGNHMQGACPCEEAYGLEYEGELVAVMSFGKSRFNKSYHWELLRFATKAGTSVVGGASRIFSMWKKLHPDQSIISFSDNRWGTGSFYRSLGFREDGHTGQGYFYTNSNGVRRSRQQHMKHKLPVLFENVNMTMTERDICWHNGWYRVWDLGNTRWVQLL